MLSAEYKEVFPNFPLSLFSPPFSLSDESSGSYVSLWTLVMCCSLVASRLSFRSRFTFKGPDTRHIVRRVLPLEKSGFLLLYVCSFQNFLPLASLCALSCQECRVNVEREESSVIAFSWWGYLLSWHCSPLSPLLLLLKPYFTESFCQFWALFLFFREYVFGRITFQKNTHTHARIYIYTPLFIYCINSSFSHTNILYTGFFILLTSWRLQRCLNLVTF